jgi:FixJ family two-component response regulator
VARKKVRHFAERTTEFLRDTRADSEPTVVGTIGADSQSTTIIKRTLTSLSASARAFETPHDFLKEAARDSLACLIVEARLVDRSGLDFYEELSRSRPLPPTIFLGKETDVQLAVRAIKLGGIAFLTKPLDERQALDTIQAALWKNRAQQNERKIVAELEHRLSTLTSREREIMTLLLTGPRNKDIAAQIDVADGTVKAHRNQIMRKMGARSLPVLLGMAQLLGFEGATPQALVAEAFERKPD